MLQLVDLPLEILDVIIELVLFSPIPQNKNEPTDEDLLCLDPNFYPWDALLVLNEKSAQWKNFWPPHNFQCVSLLLVNRDFNERTSAALTRCSTLGSRWAFDLSLSVCNRCRGCMSKEPGYENGWRVYRAPLYGTGRIRWTHLPSAVIAGQNPDRNLTWNVTITHETCVNVHSDDLEYDSVECIVLNMLCDLDLTNTYKTQTWNPDAMKVRELRLNLNISQSSRPCDSTESLAGICPDPSAAAIWPEMQVRFKDIMRGYFASQFTSVLFTWNGEQVKVDLK